MNPSAAGVAGAVLKPGMARRQWMLLQYSYSTVKLPILMPKVRDEADTALF